MLVIGSLDWLNYVTSGVFDEVHKISSHPQPIVVTSNKDDGVIKLFARNMKRVARMPVKDMGEILKTLKKHAKRRRVWSTSQMAKGKGSERPSLSNSSSTSSGSSVNKDWEN